MLTYIKDDNNLIKLSNILNENFMNFDFINYNGEIDNQFDIIVGNPPYIEYNKYKGERNKNITFGNVYGDVLYNIIPLVKKNGAIGFVLPLSYSSTQRMRKLRDYIIEDFSTQFVLSFADRPDCLFTGVHQKLNIIIAKKSKKEHKLFTSRYRF